MGHDVRVLLSMYGGRGDIEPVVGLVVQLRALGAEARMLASPDFSEGQPPELRTWPTTGSTGLEAPAIRSASAVRRGTAAWEVSQ
jgi:hypothetical protein